MHSVRVAFGDAPASGFLPCISIGLMGLGNSASQCHRHPNWAGFHGDRRLPGMPLDARFNMAGLVSSAQVKSVQTLWYSQDLELDSRYRQLIARWLKPTTTET